MNMAMVLLNASQKATDAAFNAMNTAIKENKPELISETSSGPGADLTSKKDEMKEKKPKQQKKVETPSFVTYLSKSFK